ncbi:MAG: D-lactate dehydrogenase, partial [Brevibacterium sp.]|nr:D-lactate dehydrogenase [Brevibacterium sp.]
MLGQSRQPSSPAISAFVGIMGKRHVLTSARATAPYAKGNRFGGGNVLAVLRPGSLVDMWR